MSRVNRTRPRAKTIPAWRPLTKVERREGAELEIPGDVKRPTVLADCADRRAPCPWASCRYHLAVEVTEVGSLKLNHPDRDLVELGATCTFDIVSRGEATGDEVGAALNISHERVRQIEVRALLKLAQALR